MQVQEIIYSELIEDIPGRSTQFLKTANLILKKC